jgi:glycosyltransferase involved in cell wall biosynthesis
MTDSIVGLYRGFDSGKQFSMKAMGEFVAEAARSAFAPMIVEECFDEPRLAISRSGQGKLGKLFYNLDRYVLNGHPFMGRRLNALVITDHSDGHVTLRSKARHTIIVCHDILPKLLATGEIEGPKPSRLGEWLFSRNLEAMRRADLVICVSDNTRRELVERLGVTADRALTIHNPNLLAMDSSIFQGDAIRPELRSLLDSGRPIILGVGGGKFVKNAKAFPEVVERLRRDHGLDVHAAIVGRRDFPASNVDDRLHFFGQANGAELRALYRSAAALYFPSLYEGFGLPIIEAQSLGLPIVSSDRGSLPEVVGAGGKIVGVHDHEAAAQALADIIGSKSVADTLRQAGLDNVERFAPATIRDRYISAFQALAQ